MTASFSFYNAIEKRCHLPVYGGDIVKLAVLLDSSISSYFPNFVLSGSAIVNKNKLMDFAQVYDFLLS